MLRVDKNKHDLDVKYTAVIIIQCILKNKTISKIIIFYNMKIQSDINFVKINLSQWKMKMISSIGSLVLIMRWVESESESER